MSREKIDFKHFIDSMEMKLTTVTTLNGLESRTEVIDIRLVTDKFRYHELMVPSEIKNPKEYIANAISDRVKRDLYGKVQFMFVFINANMVKEEDWLISLWRKKQEIHFRKDNGMLAVSALMDKDE